MHFKSVLKALSPTYFSMVMATGIIGIGLHLHAVDVLSRLYLFFNMGLFIVLLASSLLKIVYAPKEVKSDFHSYSKAPSLLCIVPATCILGNQLVLNNFFINWVPALLIFAFFCWLIIGYGLYFNLTVAEAKIPLKDGINGGWLLFVVAIQALSILITLIAESNEHLLFLSLCLFSLGALFYLYIISLIIYRMSFFELHADELGAPYWINMGATSITVLAGCMLILFSNKGSIIQELTPFLKGFIILFWSAGTWWIPLLIMLGIWKHFIKKVKLTSSSAGYNPSYWSLVFPLGMYSVCTFRLSQILDYYWLNFLSEVFLAIAIMAWLIVLLGLIKKSASARL